MAKSESSGTDLATYEDLEREISTHLDQPELEDPEAVSRLIVERIMQAENVDDVLAGQGIVHARDFVGVDHVIEKFRLMRSDFTEGIPAYAVCDARYPDPLSGEIKSITYSCGSRNVLAQLWRLSQLRAFPVRVRVVESPRPTAQGYTPMWLEAAGPVT